MTVVFAALGGFLGAGKTTTLLALARAYEAQGRRVAVITNDQGTDLVDSALAGAASPLAGEVTGGCFCCRFEDLLDVTSTAVARGADVVLAEAVGSCTDLRATVVRPLRRLHGFHVAPLTAVVDPARFTELATAAQADLAYLFDRQLAEADVIALNKSDQGDSSPVRKALQALHPTRPVLTYSALTGTGLPVLLTHLSAQPAPDTDLALDYDRYAAAEAQLAWLNHTVEVHGPFDPAHWARSLLTELAARPWLTGHAKVHLTAADGSVTKASAVNATPVVDASGGPTTRAHALINARVAAPPAELDHALAEALHAADAATGALSTSATPPASFSPAYPRPVHRLPA